MQLYGEGLERIFDAVAEDGSDALRARLVDDGVVASLMLIHGLYPVTLETRVREALDSVRPYMETHGGDVELLGDRGRGRAAAAAGLLPRLRRVGLDARAGHQAGAAGGGARPRGDRGRGRRRGARRRDPAADGVAPASWMNVPGLAAPRAGGDRRRLDRRRSWWWRTSTAICSPTATRARRAAGGWTAGAARGRDAGLPVVLALVRAAARRPLHRGLRAAARARAAAARGRGRASQVAA